MPILSVVDHQTFQIVLITSQVYSQMAKRGAQLHQRSKRLKAREDREEMTFAAEVLLDLSTSSASMPPTNDASTQTDLAYTDIDCLMAECTKARANELRLSKVVDDLESELRERKSNLRLIQGSDMKTRFYTGLPTFAVFMTLFKFI